MPELPDITVYIEALRKRIDAAQLCDTTLRNPFFLRTVSPSLEAVQGTRVSAVERIGKRIAIVLDDRYALVTHLMIAGRLQWHDAPRGPGGRNVLADFRFDTGVLRVTEAGTRKRASLHVVQCDSRATLDPGGLEVLDASPAEFAGAMKRENHTLKRALTDPRILSGIGNAYSDEILHAARLSPFAQTRSLDDASLRTLYEAIKRVVAEWTERLRNLYGDDFPGKVTAFREGMAVHGRFGQPCPVCATTVQRIRYAQSETNYCPRCQTDGKIYADRSLSRLLKNDWPRTIEELERGLEPDSRV